MEDPSVFEDVDDILAYYSDSPVLGRTNENHICSEFGFDESDWGPELIFADELEAEPKVNTFI